MASPMELDSGEKVIAFWDNGYIRCQIDDATATLVLAMEDETGVALLPLADGRWMIVYQDAEGTIQRIYSSDRGQTWA